MRVILLVLLLPPAGAAFVGDQPTEGYQSHTIALDSNVTAFTVERHFQVNESVPAFVWFDPWTAEAAASGYRVSYRLGAVAPGVGALLFDDAVDSTNLSATATLQPAVPYELQFTVTLPSLRVPGESRFVGIVGLRESRSQSGSGGILEPSLGTRLDVTVTAPSPPGPEGTPAVAHVAPGLPGTWPWWLVGLAMVALFAFRRRRGPPATTPSLGEFQFHEGGTRRL
ncbi:MAG: hypothetical protein ACYDBQ_11945 [Thermoplasmatota archaeon]